MKRRPVRADRLVREYRDEVGRELGRLLRLAKRLGIPREQAVAVLSRVPYELGPREAEALLKRLAGRRGRRG